MKSRISDLMDGIMDDSVDICEQCICDPVQIREKVFKRLPKNTRAKRRRSRLSRTALIAASLALTLSVSALAYVGFVVYGDPAAMLEAFFGDASDSRPDGIVEFDESGDAVVALPGWERVPVNEELAADLAESIGAVDASVAWDGYTLKVEAALYDPQTQSGLLYYSIENPDGVSGYVVRAQNSVIFPKESIDFAPGLGSGWGGACYLDEVRTTATKVYLCTYYIGCEGIAGEDWEPDKLQLLVRSNMDGELLASVEFEHSCGSVSGLNLAGGSIVVSPIGIRIYSAEMGYESGNDIKSIVLNFDSGEKYVVLDESNVLWEGTDNTTYGLLDGVSDVPSVTYTFNRLVDIGALESVTINGCDY